MQQHSMCCSSFFRIVNYVCDFLLLQMHKPNTHIIQFTVRENVQKINKIKCNLSYIFLRQIVSNAVLLFFFRIQFGNRKLEIIDLEICVRIYRPRYVIKFKKKVLFLVLLEMMLSTQKERVFLILLRYQLRVYHAHFFNAISNDYVVVFILDLQSVAYTYLSQMSH